MNLNAMTSEDIGRFFGVSRHTVQGWRRDHGLRLKPSLHQLLDWIADKPFALHAANRGDTLDMVLSYRKAKR
jgi:hypothetical protein